MAIRNPNENEIIKEYDELQSDKINDLEAQLSWGDWVNLTVTGGWTGTSRVRMNLGLDIVEFNYDLTAPSTVVSYATFITVPYSYNIGKFTVFPVLSTSGEVGFFYGGGSNVSVPEASGIKANATYTGTHIYKRVP